ncbi:MAG: Zn-ribbon domain-containing OB-fold protein [Parahaliea sp.]
MYHPDCAPRFDTDLVRPYWEALARGELVLPACSECGRWQWYPAEYVKCHGDAHHVWQPVTTRGTVFTFTVVHRSFLPGAPRDASPYVSALVELDGIAGVRLPTFLINLGEARPRIGMAVCLAPLKRSSYTAPAFEPCAD